MSHPFLGENVPGLYATEDRTRQRSDALLTAKIGGRNISDVILEHADDANLPIRPNICDIGCGQGRTTVRIARRYPLARVIALDGSPAMTAAARERASGLGVSVLTGDFHHLPLADHCLDLAVAVMCLYHSPTPAQAVSEITRTLRPGGTAILVTKAADSYREFADLLAGSGLDPGARDRPSLYENAGSENLPDLAEQGGLTVSRVEHETHTFTFADLMHTAAYLVTCPQYVLPSKLRDAAALSEALRKRLPDGAVTTTATITYVIGHP
ncbi:class I SAM-dependent methyltransferase [Actinocorallia longicatena]|uniref:Methyltransferase type 11 domain-containing protein n=1 Tax=Actinocorallia longicatena TaxID=111803 RepID=A0ABP6QDM8_9ACTN